jgi:hypothetical protein
MHDDDSASPAAATSHGQTEAGPDMQRSRRTDPWAAAAAVAGAGLVLLIAAAAAAMLLRNRLPLHHAPPWLSLALFGGAVLLAITGMGIAGWVVAGGTRRRDRTPAAQSVHSARSAHSAQQAAPGPPPHASAISDPTAARPEASLRSGPDREPLRHFQVDSGSARQVVAAARVEWIEACGNYVRLHLRDGSHLYRMPMARLEAELDRSRFLRIHRSTIVNVSAVEAVEPLPSGDATVRLVSGARVRLSRRYAGTFHERTGRPC